MARVLRVLREVASDRELLRPGGGDVPHVPPRASDRQGVVPTFSFDDVDKRLANLAEESTPWEKSQAKERVKRGESRGETRGKNLYSQLRVEHVTASSSGSPAAGSIDSGWNLKLIGSDSHDVGDGGTSSSVKTSADIGENSDARTSGNSNPAGVSSSSSVGTSSDVRKTATSALENENEDGLPFNPCPIDNEDDPPFAPVPLGGFTVASDSDPARDEERMAQRNLLRVRRERQAQRKLGHVSPIPSPENDRPLSWMP